MKNGKYDPKKELQFAQALLGRARGSREARIGELKNTGVVYTNTFDIPLYTGSVRDMLNIARKQFWEVIVWGNDPTRIDEAEQAYYTLLKIRDSQVKRRLDDAIDQTNLERDGEIDADVERK